MLPAVPTDTTPTRGPNRIATLFNQFFNEPLFSSESVRSWTGLSLTTWQDESHLYLEADLPGVTESDVEVTMIEGDLLIRGERKCERAEAAYDYRRYGKFEQRISLPFTVDMEGVEANLANGVLRVTLPKAPEAKPRKIAIRGPGKSE